MDIPAKWYRFAWSHNGNGANPNSNLILLSGRPGAGKTAFGNWLRDNLGFVHIEIDVESKPWLPLLCDSRSPEKAAATVARARALGADVVVEWGFPTSMLARLGYLREAGFDTWWFDGDEDAAQEGYIKRRGSSDFVMAPYRGQVSSIAQFWPQIERFYGDHVIHTVTSGPKYLPFMEIASQVIPKSPQLGNGVASHASSGDRLGVKPMGAGRCPGPARGL